MAMNRKLKWLAIVFAVSLLGFGTALFLLPRDRITAESWQKIRIGMTEEEVAEILGSTGMNYWEFSAQYEQLEEELVPAPWELKNPKPILEAPAGRHLLVDWDRVKVWSGRRGCIKIDLDQDNHVCWKQF